MSNGIIFLLQGVHKPLMARWQNLFKEIRLTQMTNLVFISFILNTYNTSKAHLGCICEGLMVNLHCKSDYIQSHHGNTSLDISMRLFLEIFNKNGRNECGHHFLRLGNNKGRKRVDHECSLCFLTVDAVWPVASHSYPTTPCTIYFLKS